MGPKDDTQLDYLKRLSDSEVKAKLKDAGLSGLTTVLLEALGDIRKVQTAVELNAKFQDEAFFEFSFGSIQTFYSGLIGLVGPPLLLQESFLNSMEYEHCEGPDC